MSNLTNIMTDITKHINTVNTLKNILETCKKDYKNEILLEATIKDAHIYCLINALSGQIVGPLIEYYIILHYNMIKNSSSLCIGDCSKNNKNYEIKTSLGGKKHNEFNYVQLRINHNIDNYILCAFYLHHTNVEQCGELFIFNIDKSNLKKIILQYGQYAHGTKKQNGNITISDLDNQFNNKEYALRPKYNDKCWYALLQFQISDLKL